MRISDWRSDVCSSDLKTDGDNYDYWQRREPAKVEGFVSREDYQAHRRLKRLQAVEAAKEAGEYDRFVALGWCSRKDLAAKQAHRPRKVFTEEIGRASCRERVCKYVWISVVAVSLKKQGQN